MYRRQRGLIAVKRLDTEVATLLVLPTDNWQNTLYGQMCNAIEVTELQRGVGRWLSDVSVCETNRGT